MQRLNPFAFWDTLDAATRNTCNRFPPGWLKVRVSGDVPELAQAPGWKEFVRWRAGEDRRRLKQITNGGNGR